MRFSVTALSEAFPRPPCCIAGLEKARLNQLRELVRAVQPLLGSGNQRGKAVKRGWSRHLDTSHALFGPVTNARYPGALLSCPARSGQPARPRGRMPGYGSLDVLNASAATGGLGGGALPPRERRVNAPWPCLQDLASGVPTRSTRQIAGHGACASCCCMKHASRTSMRYSAGARIAGSPCRTVLG